MTGISFYLDFLISVVFILAISSTILAVAYEAYAYFFKHRGKFLKNAIKDILNDQTVIDANITELMYAHPQIDFTKKDYKSLPLYISSKNFSQTLIDVICRRYEDKWVTIQNNFEGTSILVPAESGVDRATKFNLAVEELPYSDLQILLKGFVSNSGGSIEKIQSCIESWYDEYMNRASGWYKVIVQKKMLVISFILAISINIDFIRVSSTLLTDKELTKQIAIAAENYTPPAKPDSSKTAADWKDMVQQKTELTEALYNMHAPVGWQDDSITKENWLKKLGGFILTAVLLSFGAPFWFDLLNNLINMRKAGIKPRTN